MNAYAKSADSYLSQRVFAASPTQQAALLMEAGQLHLGRAIQALERQDSAAATKSYILVAKIIKEATTRLDLEGGGEAAQSLAKLYAFWMGELMAASRLQDATRLRALAAGMGEIRLGWEELHLKQVAGPRGSGLEFGDRVG